MDRNHSQGPRVESVAYGDAHDLNVALGRIQGEGREVTKVTTHPSSAGGSVAVIYSQPRLQEKK